MAKINVTIWNEFRHEKEHEGIRKIYPEGIHGAIAKGIAADDLNIRSDHSQLFRHLLLNQE